jgi:hypothetical protein
LGYWPVLLLKMPFEVVLGCSYGVLFAHTEFVVLGRAQLWRSPTATRTPGLRQASAVRIPGEITSLAAFKYLNFLSPAFAFLEPEVRIGGDRAAPQPGACSGLGFRAKLVTLSELATRGVFVHAGLAHTKFDARAFNLLHPPR